jgi:KUP system potassium uptake protein
LQTEFKEKLKSGQVPRVPGTAVFLTQSEDDIPNLVVDHVRCMGAIQKTVICVHVAFEEYPRVAAAQRSVVRRLADGLWHVTARFGFLEVPAIQIALQDAKGFDPPVDFREAIYFAARDIVVRKPERPRLTRWRLLVFQVLYRNAVRVVDRFSLPPLRTVELARQVEI